MGRWGIGRVGRWGDGEMGKILLKGNYPDMMISDRFTKLANRFGRHCLPDTLHPTPYTLHPTPYSLLPTPYSLLPTPYTLLPLTVFYAYPFVDNFEGFNG
ncbi:hypothetical protein [Moorena sp. SIO4G3]|uniref:hypothetical protein n=1 Tax=Moorena sp. SIO4G3 TaxID=2607821 RepID=UPI00142A2EFF|nr:hypothetical protein [Moorena sp. SIO4G3]NEO80517.1 hypothetical protein [Moorena sp. SIO4G3]